MDKKTIAVIFGGKSLEHDVSVLSALHVIQSIDYSKYNVIPVYISIYKEWFFGEELLNKKNYPFNENFKRKVKQVTLSMEKHNRPRFDFIKKGVLKKKEFVEFDIIFPVLHGGDGENGNLQGLFESLSIPYAGPRVLANAIGMDKPIQKKLFSSLGVPVLPDFVIKKPYLKQGDVIDTANLIQNLDLDFEYPVCVKPAKLGSSVGVYKAKNKKDVDAAVLNLFKIDNKVIIEPFIEDMKEYNVSVTNCFGDLQTSAIEKPIREEDTLSFKEKYLKGKKSKLEGGGEPSGMVAMTREFNPKDLKEKHKKIIIESAKKIFNLIDGTGAYRVDFYLDKKKDEIYLTEINTIPGSLAYYLWEKAEKPIIFTDYLTALIEEGFREYKYNQKDIDLANSKSAIF